MPLQLAPLHEIARFESSFLKGRKMGHFARAHLNPAVLA